MLIPLSKPIALFIKRYADSIIKTNSSLYQMFMLNPLSKPIALFIKDLRCSHNHTFIMSFKCHAVFSDELCSEFILNVMLSGSKVGTLSS